ncbi:Gfo/Idh/MocA family oxidoreductase [Akkermansiaceae bacterium]|nr:Gfo/Idh/MocA family oxidoreductase [Akkermansiaceae bacterium]
MYDEDKSGLFDSMQKLIFLLFTLMGIPSHCAEPSIRIGMIGLDTSHVTAFSKIINDPTTKNHVKGARVVAAFKGGSPDIESSISRVDGFTKTLRDDLGVEICDTIEDLCGKVDAIMIESVDGRPHLSQAKPVIAAGLPLFLDKPVAGSLKDTLEIYRLAKEVGVPIFSSSSLRYGKSTQTVRGGSIGKVTYARCSSPAKIEPHHPDLFWYGIHGCESLFTVMGTGCQSVIRKKTTDGLIEVKGTWEGGRIGIFREGKGYSGIAKNAEGEEVAVGAYDGYAPLVVEVIKFFKTKKPPVSADETIELFAFMEAADESKRRGGQEVTLKEVLTMARK